MDCFVSVPVTAYSQYILSPVGIVGVRFLLPFEEQCEKDRQQCAPVQKQTSAMQSLIFKSVGGMLTCRHEVVKWQGLAKLKTAPSSFQPPEISSVSMVNE